MFAYKYMRDHLLSFFQKDVPLPMTKRILRNALRDIAALHDKGIVHADIKPDNSVIDWEEKGDKLVVKEVQIADPEGHSLRTCGLQHSRSSTGQLYVEKSGGTCGRPDE